jgi:hypothetical protein
MRQSLLALIVIGGCGGTPPATQSPYVTGFMPGPAQPGYTRYITPIIPNLQPGSDITMCQFLTGPSPSEIDVADVVGQQSHGGHHVLLYSTTNVKEAVGTSRPCTVDDMEQAQFLGGIGGEGTGNVTLPDGYVFRLPQGRVVMANTHFLNAGTTTVDGQAVLDVKYEPVDLSRRTAAMLAVTLVSFTVPAQQPYAIDGHCKAPQDISLLMFADHMHEHGTSIFNEIVHADGTKDMLANDPVWTRDLIFNPLYKRWDPKAPLQIKAGDQFHIHCEWQGGPSALSFPDEMCIGVGFFDGASRLICGAQPG